MSTNSNAVADGHGGWFWDAGCRRYWRYATDSAGNYALDANGQYVRTWQPESTQNSQQNTTYYNVERSQSQTIARTTQPQNTDHDSTPRATEYASNQHTVAGATQNTWPHVRADSNSSRVPAMAPGAPDYIRDRIEIKGTPQLGWYESLDTSYCVRTHADEYEFFQKGRVFAMLWSEPAGESIPKRTATDNSRLTAHPNATMVQGRYGENIYCSIRRFVIMRVNRQKHFVEACAITTYGARGVLKPGCNASEHTIVYLKGNRPACIPGEREKGMTKDPIAIEPSNVNESMLSTSRLRLGKTYTIECNVKVRDIGKVAREDRTKLLRYYQDERNVGFEADDDDDADDISPSAQPTAQNTNWSMPQGGVQDYYRCYDHQGYQQ